MQKNKDIIVRADAMLDLLDDLGIAPERVAVLRHIVKNTRPETNEFMGTHMQIAEACGVNPSTVNRHMQMLLKKGFLRKTNIRGVYIVGPDIMWWGDGPAAKKGEEV